MPRGEVIVALALAACSFEALGSGKSDSADPSTGSHGTSGTAGSTGASMSSASSATADATTDTTTTAATTTGLPTSGGSTGDVEVAWWDAAYGFRMALRLEETADGELPAGYSVALRGFDWRPYLEGGTVLNGGTDVRVVEHTPAGGVELHRRIIRFSSNATEIWFKTTEAITDGSDDFYIYFGNPSATDPPEYWSDSLGADSPSEVYLAADNFQEHQDGECPDGWGNCGATWEIRLDVGNRYLYNGAYGQYLLSTNTWDNVLVEARVRTLATSGCPGIATRAIDSDNLVYSGYACSDTTVPPDSIAAMNRTSGFYEPIVWGSQPIQASQWHRIATAWIGDQVFLFHADQLVGTATASDVAAAGAIGLFGTYGTEGNGDDFIVRRFVNPEPTVTAGPIASY